MDIQFERQEFTEDDDRWTALFVKIDGGKWFLAQDWFHTEDQAKIIEMINNKQWFNPENDRWQLTEAYNEKREKYGEWDPWEPEQDN